MTLVALLVTAATGFAQQKSEKRTKRERTVALPRYVMLHIAYNISIMPKKGK